MTLSRAVKSIGIDTAVAVLSSLSEARSLSESAEVSHVPVSTTNTVIKNFGPKGLITRKLRDKDWTKRSVEYLITDKGREALTHFQALNKILA